MSKKHNIPEYYISEFNKIIRDVVESNFGYVRLRGEISEIRPATKGQLYLTLKDDNSILSGVVWESKIKYLKLKPEIGVEVIATGKITTWSRYKTTYQIDIDNLELAGEGALLKLIEDRKKKLASKGIFDDKYKKQIPFLPNKVGVITSPTGSVIHDIINRINERFPVPIDLWPVSVQGTESAQTIIRAIKGFNDVSYFNKPDVIIIARGGGSVEDLMTFNDEELVMSVFESKIPIVSAIGHETDTTIIDYVSDHRAPTPTAAAEKIVPVRDELLHKINFCSERFLNSMKRIMVLKANLISNLSKLIREPRLILDSYKGRFLTISKDLYNSYSILKEQKINNLEKLYSKLISPENILKIKNLQYNNIHKNLEFQISQKTNLTRSGLNNLKRLLISNSVNNNLKKGFVILKKSNKIIKKSNQLNKIDKIKIKFFDSNINVKLKKLN